MSRSVGVVAGDTSHRFAVLKAFAFSQVLILIGNVIVLTIPAGHRFVASIKGFTRTMAKSRPTVLDGVAVALRTHFLPQRARESAGMNNEFWIALFGMRLVKVHVLLRWTVATFAGDTLNGIVAFELVLRTGHMLVPG